MITGRISSPILFWRARCLLTFGDLFSLHFPLKDRKFSKSSTRWSICRGSTHFPRPFLPLPLLAPRDGPKAARRGEGKDEFNAYRCPNKRPHVALRSDEVKENRIKRENIWSVHLCKQRSEPNVADHCSHSPHSKIWNRGDAERERERGIDSQWRINKTANSIFALGIRVNSWSVVHRRRLRRRRRRRRWRGIRTIKMSLNVTRSDYTIY